MGVGTEILFIIVVAVLLLGPKRLPTILEHIARAKAHLENASRNLKSELGAQLAARPRDDHVIAHPRTVGSSDACPSREG